MHILNKSEKVKLNWIFHNEFIYSFLFFFCNKTKRENDIWTNELAEYYLTLLKENNNKKKKKYRSTILSTLFFFTFQRYIESHQLALK